MAAPVTQTPSIALPLWVSLAEKERKSLQENEPRLDKQNKDY
jgi:hypothetical protein